MIPIEDMLYKMMKRFDENNKNFKEMIGNKYALDKKWMHMKSR